MPQPSLLGLLRRVHQDEEGSVSLETVLIIGAIALPVLIFLLMYVWPRIKDYLIENMDQLESGADQATSP